MRISAPRLHRPHRNRRLNCGRTGVQNRTRGASAYAACCRLSASLSGSPAPSAGHHRDRKAVVALDADGLDGRCTDPLLARDDLQEMPHALDVRIGAVRVDDRPQPYDVVGDDEQLPGPATASAPTGSRPDCWACRHRERSGRTAPPFPLRASAGSRAPCQGGYQRDRQSRHCRCSCAPPSRAWRQPQA